MGLAVHWGVPYHDARTYPLGSGRIFCRSAKAYPQIHGRGVDCRPAGVPGFLPLAGSGGFLVGAIVSYVNQRWLERAVDALGERITTGESKERGGGIVFRAVLRYVFIALGAYVIFNVSLAGLYGFLGGVCLPIAAIACEVAVEVFVTLRRGF